METKITSSNFETLKNGELPLVVDFWATWCGPCRAMSPLIDELADEYKDRVLICKYNCDDESDFASSNRVMSLPTILFFKGGKRVDLRLAGSQTRESLVAKIEELINL